MSLQLETCTYSILKLLSSILCVSSSTDYFLFSMSCGKYCKGRVVILIAVHIINMKLTLMMEAEGTSSGFLSCAKQLGCGDCTAP